MKTFFLLAALIWTQVLGDIWLSRGMKGFGAVTFHWSVIPMLIGFLFSNPWIWLGVICLVVSLGIYLTAISRLDLSYVLPIHAFSYVLNAILAGWILGEQISWVRWLSTSFIALGVLLVGLGDSQTSRLDKPQTLSKKVRHFPLFIAPLGLAISKSWLAIFVIAIADASGDVLLALGMKRAGRVERASWQETLALIRRIIANPAILGGILCQTIAFTSFIMVLSWADISFVRPGTALTYVFSLLGAKYLLKETLSREKLIGVILVGFGIAIHH